MKTMTNYTTNRCIFRKYYSHRESVIHRLFCTVLVTVSLIKIFKTTFYFTIQNQWRK